MKKFLILLSTLLAVSTAKAQFTELNVDVSKSHYMPLNLILNPFCSPNATAGITSVGVAPTKTASGGLNGYNDCAWNPTASGNKVTWAIKSFPKGISGVNCEARINYIGQLAGLVKAYVNAGTISYPSGGAVLPNAVSTTSAVDYSIANFPCETSMSVSIEATGDAVASEYFPYLGKATNVGTTAQAIFVGGAEQTGASGCTYAESTSSGATDWKDLTGATGCNSWSSVGTISSPSANTNDITITNGAPGEHVFHLGGHFQNSASNQTCRWRITDGTLTSKAVHMLSQSGGAMVIPELTFNVPIPSAGTRTFKLQAADDGAGTCSWVVSSSNHEAVWKVERFPTSSETSYRADASPAYWGGYHDSTCGGWTRTNTAYGDFAADASCAVVSTAASNISCVATGSVLPALACTFNKPGVYSVCANVPANSGSGSGGSLQLTDGTTAKAWGSFSATSTTPNNLCGIYEVTGLTKTFTVQGKVGSGTITIDGQGATGYITWNIWAGVGSMPMPLLVGSISSNSAGMYRLETVKLSGATWTISNNNGWISSVTDNATGNFTLNFLSGMFSSTPTCWCNAIDSSGNNTNCTQDSATTASSSVYRFAVATGTSPSDRDVNVTCFGPR